MRGPAIGRVGSSERSFLEALRVQARVIWALMVREAMRKFGHENLGFFWILGEPLLLTLSVMLMWSVIQGKNGHGHSIGIIPFALTSYTMLTLWRHVVQGSVHAMRNNAGLFFHRNVRFLDILIAKCALEGLGGGAAFMVAYIPLALFGVVEPIDDPLLLIGGWLMMTWFAFAFGLTLAALSEISEPVERFVAPIMYVTLPLTGGFYMVEWLPETAQKIVLWSPLVHAFEMYRGGFFGPSVPTTWDLSYLAFCCIVMTAIGLPLAREAQKHLRLE